MFNFTPNAEAFDAARRAELEKVNAEAAERSVLEQRHGKVWNVKELQESFEVIGFMAPFLSVRRKSDGKRGSMEFQHSPRFYFDFQEDG